MWKRFIAPIAAIAVVVALHTTIALNAQSSSLFSEREQNYFIKPIPGVDLIVVEPNYGHFFDPHSPKTGDSSGEVLYSSLEQLKADYQIKKTEMIRFERKGQLIPNLYVHINPISTQKILAEKLPDKQRG